jgi:hypothetical protein
MRLVNAEEGYVRNMPATPVLAFVVHSSRAYNSYMFNGNLDCALLEF